MSVRDLIGVALAAVALAGCATASTPSHRVVSAETTVTALRDPTGSTSDPPASASVSADSEPQASPGLRPQESASDGGARHGATLEVRELENVHYAGEISITASLRRINENLWRYSHKGDGFEFERVEWYQITESGVYWTGFGEDCFFDNPLLAVPATEVADLEQTAICVHEDGRVYRQTQRLETVSVDEEAIEVRIVASVYRERANGTTSEDQLVLDRVFDRGLGWFSAWRTNLRYVVRDESGAEQSSSHLEFEYNYAPA